VYVPENYNNVYEAIYILPACLKVGYELRADIRHVLSTEMISVLRVDSTCATFIPRIVPLVAKRNGITSALLGDQSRK
jgi:hypothetical protein